MITNLLIFFIAGLIIGSFLNVVIYRLDDYKTIFFGRSHCQNCKKELKWYDLVPLFSYILLLGKCRFCKEKISIQYPLVELGTGLLFAITFLFFGLSWASVFYLLIFSLLIVVFVYDLKFMLIPDFFVWSALVLAFLGGWYFGHFSFWEMIYSGLIGGIPFVLLVLFSKEKLMGSGDIKLGFLLGLLLGFPNIILGIFLSFILGSVAGILLILVTTGKLTASSLKRPIAFAPFVILALVISLFYGSNIINWYLGI